MFEDPMMGLIAMIIQAQTPSALRKSTIFVIETIYSREGAPPEIAEFTNRLEEMLPDDLPHEHLPKLVTAIAQVLREVKEDRIRKESLKPGNLADGPGDDIDFDFDDEDDDDDDDAPKKRRGRAGKRKKGERSVKVMIAAGIALLILFSGVGGGVYYYFFMDHETSMGERAQTLIDQMEQAALGKGPERHVFGWALTVETRAGLTGVTAVGVPSDACASVAWYFVNRGNVLINDQLPKKIAPNILKQFCDEKGQRAKLTWVSKAQPAATE